jgi:hypothetical protein
MGSSQLDVVTFHSNGDRSLQQIHRHDQALILALAHEDPLDSIKGSAANSNAFPDGDKGMREAWNLLTNGFPEAFNLLIGNRSAMSFIPNETQHARRPQHLQALLAGLNHTHEGVATKQRDFHSSPAVAPIMNLMQEGKKGAHALLFKLRSNPLFVPGDGVNRVPAWFSLSDF